MGIKNYLIDGVSCAGKTTVCNELQRRGYHIDATAPLSRIVDTILAHANLVSP
jgi:predicted ATPase